VPGGKLVTLRDAGEYIAKLPKAVHDRPEWQAEAEALTEVSWFVRCRSGRGSTMQGHIFSGGLMGEWLVRDFSGAPVQNWMVVAGAIVLVCAVLAWLIRP